MKKWLSRNHDLGKKINYVDKILSTLQHNAEWKLIRISLFVLLYFCKQEKQKQDVEPVALRVGKGVTGHLEYHRIGVNDDSMVLKTFNFNDSGQQKTRVINVEKLTVLFACKFGGILDYIYAMISMTTFNF